MDTSDNKFHCTVTLSLLANKTIHGVQCGLLFSAFLLSSGVHALDMSLPESWLDSQELQMQYGLETIKAHHAYAAGYTGKNVKLGILDTAIFAIHPEFSGEGKLQNLVTTGYRDIDDSYLGVKKGDYFYYDGTLGRYYAPVSHGTHVAGIAAGKRNAKGMHGVAFDAQLIGAEMSSSSGEETDHKQVVYSFDSAVYGAAWKGLIDSGSRVINNSWGLPTGYEKDFSKQHAQEQFNEIESLLAGSSGGVYQGIIDAVNHGVLMVFAAGNKGNRAEPTALAGLPAFIPELASSYLNVVAIEEYFPSMELTPMSTRCGYTASFCVGAPGSYIYSTTFKGTDVDSLRSAYGYKSGTSMAAPHVAGSAAVLMERFPYMTGAQIATVLKTTAGDLGKPGVDEIFGWGMINLQKAINGPAMFVTNADLDEQFQIEGAWGDGQFVANIPGRGAVLAAGTAMERVCSHSNCEHDIWSNDISGHGGLTKVGDGTLMLTGNNTYQGPTRVQAGRLAIDGSIQSTVSVGGSGIISGNGRLGSLYVNDGGTVAPGHSIGTLHVDGDVVFSPGSFYQVDIGNGISGLLSSEGKITLNGGHLEVNLTDMDRTSAVLLPLQEMSLEIMQATEGIQGEFTQVTSNLDTLFFGALTHYQPNIVNLTMGYNGRPFSRVVEGKNAQRAAAAAQKLKTPGSIPTSSSGDNTLYNKLLLLTSSDQAHTVFEQLSGQVHADVLTSQIDESRYLRETVIDRLRQVSGLGEYHDIKAQDNVWGRLIGGWERASGNNDATSYRRSTYGFLFGVDSNVLTDWQLGLTAGYTRTSLHGGYRSSSNVDNYHAGIYGGRQVGQFALRVGTNYSWHRFTTSRSVDFNLFANHLKAKYSGLTQQFFADLGYLIESNQLMLEPFINLTYINAGSHGFTEKGGEAALAGTKNHQDVPLSTLGLRMGSSFTLGKSHIALQGELGWLHDYSDQQRQREVRYINAESTFLTSSVPAARNSAVVKIAGDVNLANNVILSVGYSGTLSKKYQDNSVNANINWRF